MNSKITSAKNIAYFLGVALSFILCLTSKVTGDSLFSFWVLFFVIFTSSNVGQKFILAKFGGNSVGVNDPKDKG